MPKTPFPAAGEAVPADARDMIDCLYDAETKILRAKDLAELMFMAGESCHQPAKNALTAGACTLCDVLREALNFLEAARVSAKGGAA